MRGLIFLTACVLLSGSKAFADDATCLARILHAESQGESFEGLIATGQSAITRADDQDANLCDVRGVHRTRPVKSMAQYYMALARELLAHRSTSISKGADSWNTGSKPAHAGTVTRHIDNHTFYILKVNGEKK